MSQDDSRPALFSRLQVFSLLFMIFTLGIGFYLLQHNGRLPEVTVARGNPADYALRIDLNTASWEEIALLPGLGPAKAKAIVSYRETNGAFAEPADLEKVPGIGPATIEGISKYVSFTGD